MEAGSDGSTLAPASVGGAAGAAVDEGSDVDGSSEDASAPVPVPVPVPAGTADGAVVCAAALAGLAAAMAELVVGFLVLVAADIWAQSTSVSGLPRFGQFYVSSAVQNICLTE